MREIKDLERQASAFVNACVHQMQVVETLKNDYDYVDLQLPITDAATTRIAQLREQGKEEEANEAQVYAELCAKASGETKIVKDFVKMMTSKLKEAEKNR